MAAWESNNVALLVHKNRPTKLRSGGVQEGVLYPACLPESGQTIVGTRGIFASWKDPVPLYVYYELDFDRTVEKYRQDELLLRHTRLDVVECADPSWMASDTFYPRGVLCARDPSCASCLDTGDSGSGAMMPRADGSFSWIGPLSFYRGCDRALLQNLDFQDNLNVFSGENPGVFTSGLCYLGWVAAQYGLKHRGQRACQGERGNRQDAASTDCATINGDKCDFESRFPTSNYFSSLSLNINDPRDIEFSECTLRTAQEHTNMVFMCPINSTSLGICPNNCLGVRASAIVAGGTALLAGAGLAGLTLLQAVVGLGAVALSGAMLAMQAREECLGPLYCRARATGRCCLVRGSLAGPRCPRSC